MVRKNQINRVFEVLDFPKSRVGAKIVDLYRQDITPKEAFENARFQSLSRAPKREIRVQVDQQKKIGGKLKTIKKTR